MDQIICSRGCESNWKVKRKSLILDLPSRSTEVLCDRERECKSQTIHLDLLSATSLSDMGFLKNWFARTWIAPYGHSIFGSFAIFTPPSTAAQEPACTYYVIRSVVTVLGGAGRRRTPMCTTYFRHIWGPTVYGLLPAPSPLQWKYIPAII